MPGHRQILKYRTAVLLNNSTYFYNRLMADLLHQFDFTLIFWSVSFQMATNICIRRDMWVLFCFNLLFPSGNWFTRCWETDTHYSSTDILHPIMLPLRSQNETILNDVPPETVVQSCHIGLCSSIFLFLKLLEMAGEALALAFVTAAKTA